MKKNYNATRDKVLQLKWHRATYRYISFYVVLSPSTYPCDQGIVLINPKDELRYQVPKSTISGLCCTSRGLTNIQIPRSHIRWKQRAVRKDGKKTAFRTGGK